MSLETEHHGYKITYAENQDVWRCWALDLEGKTLSDVKTKINKVDAAARKLERVAVLVFRYSGSLPAFGHVLSWASQEALWVMCGRDRRKEKCVDVALDTPVAREAVARAKHLLSEAAALQKQGSDLLKAIPRWQPSAAPIADDTEIKAPTP